MPDTFPRAVAVLRPGEWSDAADAVSLDYAGRFLRRRRLTTGAGREILADLPETVSLNEGDALRLADGSVVAVRAAAEDLVEVRGPDLSRLAWHIGNRHTPCEIGPARLVIRRDHVIEAMLTHLGATLTPLSAPFRPEGGAYGHGRTLGHEHGAGRGGEYDHDHDHDHGHDHPHGHEHGHDHGHDHGHEHGHGQAHGQRRVHTHVSHGARGGGRGEADDEMPEGEA